LRLGLLEALGGLTRLLGLLADHVLAVLQRLLHRRQHQTPNDQQDDGEDDQLANEGAVGKEKVVSSRENLVPHGDQAPGWENTIRAMNARLMKYAASTRPTVMKNGRNRRPCASGWRATPAMNWLPATPSPIPAPIAPPPRIRPPPM